MQIDNFLESSKSKNETMMSAPINSTSKVSNEPKKEPCKKSRSECSSFTRPYTRTVYEQNTIVHNANLIQPYNYPTSDLMICGICKLMFQDFEQFFQHKQSCLITVRERQIC